MLGIYFSGTGNSKYAINTFLKEYNDNSVLYSVEDKKLIEEIKNYDKLIFSYPVQYSTVPKFLRDFINDNGSLWKGKKVFIIATMGLFSGDGAGVLARLLQQYGAVIVGGLHLIMPDSIADEKVLKRTKQKNIELVQKATQKIKSAAINTKNGRPPQEGLSVFSRAIGFIGQRLWFGYKTKDYNSKLKIDENKCIGCSVCVNVCPTKNIELKSGKAKANDKCTMCYRCINKRPKKAITLLGKSVIAQTSIEKYTK